MSNSRFPVGNMPPVGAPPPLSTQPMPLPGGAPGSPMPGQGAPQSQMQQLMLLFQILMQNPQFAAAVTQLRAQRQAGGAPMPGGISPAGPMPQGNPGAGGFAAFVNAKR